MNSPRTLATLLVSLAALLAVATASAQAPQAAPASPAITDSYYGAAERIDLSAPVQGDVIVAGREIVLGQTIGGDIIAAGRTITLKAPALDDVRVAGGDVVLDGAITGDITAVGRSLVIGPSAHVAGRTWVAGETIRADGVFEREVRMAGGTVQIAGEVRQPVRVFARSLEILPGAKVLAPLTYDGPQPALVSAGAILSSPIVFHQTAPNGPRRPSPATTIFFVLQLFVGGFLLYLLAPRVASEPEEILRTKPALSLGVGFVLLVTVPVAALLLIVTLIGLPLGLALGALYFVALFIGIVTTAFYIGSVEAGWFGKAPITTRGRQAGYLMAGVITLAVLRLVPVLGGLTVFLAVVFGLGGLSLWVYRTYHALPAPAGA